MVQCDDILSTVFQQGQTGAIISWCHRDDSDGTVIQPTFIEAILYTPTDNPVLITDTSITSITPVTPSYDASGTITGKAGSYYITVNFDNAAELGKWYVEITQTHESKTKTQNLCFLLSEAGASIVGDNATFTTTVYATPRDIEEYIRVGSSIGSFTAPSIGQLEQYIIMAEGEFEERTGIAFKPTFVENEIHDLQSWRQRHNDLFDEFYIATPRPIKLNHRGLLPFDEARGHKIEVYEGAEDTATAADPIRRWSRWDTRQLGRTGDYWFDAQKGELFVRKTIIFRRAAAIRVSYEYGKPISTTTNNITDLTTVINVVSTYGYKTRGYVRIGNEWFFHTGKTDTSFTGIRRAVFDSYKEDHLSGSEVYEVPDNVRRLIIIRAAMYFFQNDYYVATVADGQLSSQSMDARITKLDEEWERGLEKYLRWEIL